MVDDAASHEEGLFTLNDGKREMVDEERAKVMVAAALRGRDPASITRVCLSNKSYSSEAAAVIGEALNEMTSVTDVDFSDMIAGRPEETGLAVLRAVCGGVAGRRSYLEWVDLSDNAMGQKGIDACRDCLEQGQGRLRALLLCNDGLSEAAMGAVRDLLLAHKPTSLRTLHFYNNMSGDGGAHALAEVLPHCPELEDLRFSGTRAGRKGSVAVAKALADCPAVASGKLVRLDLADNTFGADEGAEALAKAIKSQPELAFLNLRDCALEDDGTAAVAGALSSPTCARLLRHLDLSGNEITADGGAAVRQCLLGKGAVEYVGAEENELGSRGAKQVAQALKPLAKVQRVQLGSNEIGASGAVAVVRSVQDKAALESLELNGNGIDEEGLSKIRRMLEAAGKLGALGDLDDNDEEFEEEEEEEEEEEQEGEEEEEPVAAAAAVGEEEVDELAAALGGITV